MEPKKNKIIIIGLLSILIIIQLVRIIYVFAYERQGYHSDENWSYGFANSYYEPQLYIDNNGKPKNIYEWTSSKVFKDYLEVNKGQEFSYGSVYYNQEKDFSPPLYSMVLHTVCSLFPETFSWWYAFSINIVAFILTQITLYFLGKALMKSNLAGLALCLFYGSIIGAVNCFVYLRMYGLLTLFAVLSTYLHVRLFNKKFHSSIKELILIFLVTIAGSMTHYYFLVFSFFMAVCFCLYLLFKRYWKELFLYASCMLLAVAAVIGIYPFVLSHIQSGPSLYTKQLSYLSRIEYCFGMLLLEVTGISITFPNLYTSSVLLCYIIGIIAFGGPLCFLFRKELWFLKAIKIIKIFIKKAIIIITKILRQMQWLSLFILITVFATLAVIARISNVFFMNILMDRYLFFLMPLFCTILVTLLRSIVSMMPIKLKYGKSVLFVLLVVMLIITNYLNTNCNYLFKKNNSGPDIDKTIKGSNCIIVTSDAWKLTYYASRLLDTNRFFVMSDKDGMKVFKNLNPDDSFTPLYMIIENGKFLDENGKVKAYESTVFENVKGIGLNYTEKQFTDYLSKLGWISNIKYISTEDSFAGQIDLFRIYIK